MKYYSQLTQGLRYQIEILKKADKNQKDIAELVNVSGSPICRELQRNTGKRGYRPKQAQRKAETQRKLAVKPLKMTLVVIAFGYIEVILNLVVQDFFLSKLKVGLGISERLLKNLLKGWFWPTTNALVCISQCQLSRPKVLSNKISLFYRRI